MEEELREYGLKLINKHKKFEGETCASFKNEVCQKLLEYRDYTGHVLLASPADLMKRGYESIPGLISLRLSRDGPSLILCD